ncbi:Polysaccharide pyruvyl transferase [Planctomycetes bacterium Pan216]|uniref:Polysaccharide pyruvyl transferase n=1 Tax=Kolteria novifilia TaxID=2527975 RepID=A0A518B4K4_9BACT|nr:Polysaccharide pyruvyl transferase [Planctomycetes bacterium Pan216]
MNRRQFNQAVLAGTFASAFGTIRQAIAATTSSEPKILLRSSWQTVNIGDIAHTPGVLHLLETYLPDAQITLWPSNVNNGVKEMLLERFPKLKIVNRSELKQAFAENDFLLHGSGPSLVAAKDVDRWRKETGKPYGVYGITFPVRKSSSTKDISSKSLDWLLGLLGDSSFVFFRDSKSLGLVKELGCQCPVMEFGPDGAFACDLRDDAKAEAFLKQHGLEEGKFLCCIPRLRFTPYWTIPEKKRSIDPVKHARNEAMKEHDHAQLRQAIVDIVETTDNKVLLCPEDQTQMRVGKEVLLDKLPTSVRDRVAWRPNYWLTGEAISTYVRSNGLFGNEMHSPIMCIGNGVPAIVCRWAEQTSKGYMWEDIGLGDWLFDLDDESQVAKVAPTILAMARDPEAAKAKAANARQFVEKRQRETMAQIPKSLKQTS